MGPMRERAVGPRRPRAHGRLGIRGAAQLTFRLGDPIASRQARCNCHPAGSQSTIGMPMKEALEHQEHAAHAAHGGSSGAALMVSVLAATLAICEQQAKHAEIKVQAKSIAAADTWAQYQAKSIRATTARDLADVSEALGSGLGDPAQAKVAALVTRLHTDIERYEKGDDGKAGIAKHAHALEEERDHAIEVTHSLDNAAALFELGIVLSTVSAVTRSRRLLVAGGVLGVLGVIVAVVAQFAPELVAF